MYGTELRILSHFQILTKIAYIYKSAFKCLHSNLMILTDFHSFSVNEDKLEN